MFRITSEKKFWLSRLAVLCALLLLLSSSSLTASASPPDDLSVIFNVTYYNVPTDEGFGAWSSEGLFPGAGNIYETYHSSGWDGCWRTVHTTSVLTGPTPADTLTIRMQVVRVDAEDGCETFAAEGNWVILSATGAYAGLHGQGQATVSGGVQPGQVGFDLVVHTDLQGLGHFDQ
jgi:hypothetical protein